MTSLLRLLGLDGATTVDSVDAWAWHAAAHPDGVILGLVIGIGLLLALVNFAPGLRLRLPVRVVTFFLRLGMVGILLLALCRLELHLSLRARKAQRWLALLDDSASMATADEAGGSRYAVARRDLAKLRQAVGDNVALEVQTFSARAASEAAGSGPTYLHRAIARSALRGSAFDRLVLLTDGRDVEGRDFTRLGQDLLARETAVAVRLYGTDVRPPDAAIAAEPEHAVIRLGELVVVHGSITSAAAATDTFEVRLLRGDKEVAKRSLTSADSAWFRMTHKPAKPGKYRYTLELVGKDVLPGNNQASFLVQVVEERIKVLLIEGAPRYEFKLMRYVLDTDPMVQLASICHLPGGALYIQGEPLHSNPEKGLISSRPDLFKYDVVVLRDVPRSLFRAGDEAGEARLQLLASFVEQRGGGLILMGGEDVFRAGGYEDSVLASVMPFDMTDYYSKDEQFPGRFFANVQNGLYDHPVLRLLPDPEANRERWHNLRELDGSNNVGRFRPLATPLLTRQVKLRNSRGELEERQVPVLAYQAVGEGKVVAAAVDTLWRWQLQADFTDDPPLRTLLANMVRYVAPPPAMKAGEPRVALKDATPQVGQEAVLYTVLRDKVYDPIRHADLKVTVKKPGGQVEFIYPRDLPAQPGYYEYRVMLDQPGAYQVAAEHGKLRQETSFVAGAAGNEFADLSADRESMTALANAAVGEVLDSLDDWLETADTTSATVAASRTLQVWNSPLILILFIVLVALDCYVRKRQGLP